MPIEVKEGNNTSHVRAIGGQIERKADLCGGCASVGWLTLRTSTHDASSLLHLSPPHSLISCRPQNSAPKRVILLGMHL